jgi:hypothetical protein
VPDELSTKDEQATATFEALEQGQIYLSKEEVFAQDMVNEAFVGTDGVDLRGSLAIRNVLTAAALVNTLNTDSVIRAVQAQTPDLAQRMTGLGLSASDIEALTAIFHRLAAENPPEPNEPAMLARVDQLQARGVPQMIGAAPANLYLGQYAQIALRMAWIIQSARTATMQKNDLRKLAYDAAKEQEPSLTPGAFATRVGIDSMTGISGIGRRVLGIGGNFFKDIARGVSRLFKNPLAVFKQWGEDIGRGLIALDKPFQWVRDRVPMVGYVFGGVGSAVLRELGRSLVEHSISAFNEQSITYIVGMHLTQAGFVLQLIGGVLALIPFPICTAVGAALILIGTLAVIAGQAILRTQSIMRQDRLNREAYEAEMARLKKLKQEQDAALDATGQSIAPPAPVVRKSDQTFVYAAAAVLAVFMFK